MEEQRGEDELGEWLGVDAAGGGDDEIGILQTEPLHQGTDPGRRGLHPAQLGRQLEERGALVLRKVEQDLGLAQEPVPLPLLIRIAPPGGIAMIRDVAQRRHQIGPVDQLQPVRERAPDPLDMLGFQRRCDHRHDPVAPASDRSCR